MGLLRSACSVLLCVVVLCLPVLAVDVSTVDELRAVIADLNAAPDGGTVEVLLMDGVYDLTEGDPNYLLVERNHITIRSKSGDRSKVTITGDAVSDSAVVPVIFLVYSHHFTVQDITMQKVGTHCIQIIGERDADYAVIQNCVIRDAYQQLVKVSYNEATPAVSGDYGRLSGCLLEYSAGIGPNWYIGGIDGHHAAGWIVRGNVFRNIISPADDVAEHAIHFWSDSSDTLVERNLIVNCDRGIGFGLGDRGHKSGVIRNNMIYHGSTNPGGFADVGIGLESAPNAQVYNNTVIMEHDYANAIEYRFHQTTNVLLANNLVNRQITSRDGGQALLVSNVTRAVDSWFRNVGDANLHLVLAVPSVVNQGVAVTGLVQDYDGQPRPLGGGYDIGADEWLNVTYVKNDFDGDGVSDPGCYYAPTGYWIIDRSRDGLWENWFGYANTVPIAGDFDGDGMGDFGCYHAEDGHWYVYGSERGFWNARFGYTGTVPVTGDFDGDGKTDFGCFYAPGGWWYIYKSWTGFWITQFGYDGTLPITGDFDGDGVGDFGCYYPPGGWWYVYASEQGFSVNQFGYVGTLPVTGDFDGDGLTDFGCYHTASCTWYLYESGSGLTSLVFGVSNAVPVTGDYDGDGLCDVGYYDAEIGRWVVRTASNSVSTTEIGGNGSVPIN